MLRMSRVVHPAPERDWCGFGAGLRVLGGRGVGFREGYAVWIRGAQAIERASEHRRASISERCVHGTDISEGSLIGILAWSGDCYR